MIDNAVVQLKRQIRTFVEEKSKLGFFNKKLMDDR